MNLESNEICVFDTTQFIKYKIYTLLDVNIIGNENDK